LTVFELVVAVIWWPMLVAGAIFLALVGYMLIEAFMDWVWGKQSRGQKWSRK
jgi:hypothetical protein